MASRLLAKRRRVIAMEPLQVHISPHKSDRRPSHLSPMCGWEKEETSSPSKVLTPTKLKATPEKNVPQTAQRKLLPLCYTSEGMSPNSDSGSMSELSQESSDDLLYFKVPDIKLQDLYDWSKKLNECQVTTVNPARGLQPQKSSSASAVEVNEELIALFRFEESVFAVNEKCPHAGGPLHLGDIEVLPDTSSVCVVCPWHGWKMDLSSGKVMFPLNRSRKGKVYKTMLDENQCIWIGFDRFSARCFNLSNDDF